MKYDDIILECPGNCDECNVYLECQYQTSAGQEKEEFLKKLLERDEAIESSARLSIEEPDAVKEVAEEIVEIEEAVEPEEIIEREEVVEIEEAVSVSEVEAQKEPTTEVLNKNSVETVNQVLITPISKEEVNRIYAEVFGLSFLTESIEEETINVIEEEVILDSEDNSIGNDLPVENNDESCSEVKIEELTPPSKDRIDEIFAEVFKLNEKITCVSEKLEVTQSVSQDVIEEKITTEENTVIDEKTVIPITKEDVDKIYSEVFNLTNADKLSEAQPELQPETTKTVETVLEEVAGKEATDLVNDVTCETPTEEKAEILQPADAVEEPSKEDGKEEIKDEANKEAPSVPAKETFKLTPPENNEELMQNMCAKRGRKLIYKPTEALVTKTFKVLGTDKKNDIGEKVKDILDAEIKQGVKVGYLDKFDGLSSSEIKEEYENDIVYEFADQEFKKTGVIYDGKKIKVYVYDWDGKACHHVGYVDAIEAEEIIPYLLDKEKYSFDVCGIITGGKGKRVVKEGNNLKIVKEKGDPIGIDVDIAVLNRKD